MRVGWRGRSSLTTPPRFRIRKFQQDPRALQDRRPGPVPQRNQDSPIDKRNLELLMKSPPKIGVPPGKMFIQGDHSSRPVTTSKDEVSIAQEATVAQNKGPEKPVVGEDDT